MKKIVLSFVFFSIVALASAQYYYVPRNAGQNPGGLNTDSELPDGSTGAPVGTKIVDGSNELPIWGDPQTIPFDFTFNGNIVTQFMASSSGIVTFDINATAVPSYTRAALPNASIPNNSICIWGLAGKGDNDFVISKIYGTAGSRQLWIMFSSYGYGDITTSGDLNYTYWSIVLEEKTNKIYIIDQRTGGFDGVAKVSAGIQISATKAIVVDGSPDLGNKATAGATPADNFYYEFIPGTQPQFNLANSKITLAKLLSLVKAPYTVSTKVSNLGSATITSGTFNYSVDGGATVSAPLSGLSVAKFADATLVSSAKWTPTAEGTYKIKTWISDLNGSNVDADMSNDTAFATVKVIANPRKSLVEVFTSSTCPPCTPGNIIISNVLRDYPEFYTVVKYQYYFPSNGDPYFVQEATDRGSFYGGVSSIPKMYLDGGLGANPNGGFAASNFETYNAKSSPLQMTVTHTMQGAKVNANVSIKTVGTVASGTYKLRMAVVEKRTTLNVKTNGETEFFWVMKKMLPDANGQDITLPANGQSTTVAQSYSFNGDYFLPTDARSDATAAPTGSNYLGIDPAKQNSVEDYNNLAVVAWVQNETSRAVLQSNWSMSAEQEAFPTGITEVNTNLFSVYPNPAKNMFSVSLNGATVNEVTVLNVFDITGKLIVSKNINSETTVGDIQVDCSNFNKGLYFVELKMGDKKSTQKIVVE